MVGGIGEQLGLRVAGFQTEKIGEERPGAGCYRPVYGRQKDDGKIASHTESSSSSVQVQCADADFSLLVPPLWSASEIKTQQRLRAGKGLICCTDGAPLGCWNNLKNSLNAGCVLEFSCVYFLFICSVCKALCFLNKYLNSYYFSRLTNQLFHLQNVRK